MLCIIVTVTNEFRLSPQVLTAQNANSIVADVSDITSRSSPEDQSSVTIEVLSKLFTSLSSQPPLPEAAQDLVDILSDVSKWPSDALQDDAPRSAISTNMYMYIVFYLL